MDKHTQDKIKAHAQEIGRGLIEVKKDYAYLLRQRDELLEEVKVCRAYAYNPFEPDNQSALFNDLDALINRPSRS